MPGEEEKELQSTEEIDYIAAIKELKDTTVPKEQYEKLKGENKRLLQSVLNGEQIEGVAQSSEPDIAELRNQLFGGEGDMSNLDYISTALKLRDALIEKGQPDPFLPVGHRVSPTDEDIVTAEKVAKVLQECVDYADGDSSLFTNELQRRMIDVPLPKKK